LISSSLLAVLAQRLVRKLCDECKCEDESNASHELFNLDNSAKIYKAQGCKSCNFTGFTGRIAIGELFLISEEIKEYLKGDVDDNTLMNLALKNEMLPLHEQLKQMLINGETSVDEAVRIGIK